MSENHQIITFGKYKGQPAEVLQSDPEYCQWLQGQDWFAQKFPGISTLIINNFGKPEDTPAHNRLQAMFTKPEFVKKLFMHFYDVAAIVKDQKDHYKAMYQKCLQDIEKERVRLQKEKESATQWMCVKDPENARIKCGVDVYQKIGQGRYGHYGSFWHIPNSLCFCNRAADNDSPVGKFSVDNVSFEFNGWDVLATGNIIRAYDNGLFHAFVEIKPSVGDDYPSVMRQIQANKSKVDKNRNAVYVLLYDNFCATGASLEEVQTMFTNNNIAMVSFAQIDSIPDDDERFSCFSKEVPAYVQINPTKSIRIRCKDKDDFQGYKKAATGRVIDDIETVDYSCVKFIDSTIYTTVDKNAAKWESGYSFFLEYEDGSSEMLETILFPRNEENLAIELRKIFGEDNVQIVSTSDPQPQEATWDDMLRTVHEKDSGLYSFLMCGTAEFLPDGKVQWTPAEGFTKNLCSKPGVAKIIQKSFADAAGSSISIVTAK